MIAVLGPTGQLGSAFLRLLGTDAVPVPRAELDLEVAESIFDWVKKVRPELIMNCAAYTAVDRAEQEPERARRVNASAVGLLAQATNSLGAKLVTFSTDYVFDGMKPTPYVESDPTNPLSVYGRTKLEGERLALEFDPETLVIRTSWVLSGTHRNFAASILDALRSGPVHVVDDQWGCPTLVDDLAPATMACLQAGAAGILHLTNQGATTWFGLAREIAEVAGFDPNLVKPTTSAGMARPAPRPANSVLDSERIANLGVPLPPHYRVGLGSTVTALMSRI